MSDSVNKVSDALKECNKLFVKRALEEYGYYVHHVEVADRDNSHFCVDTPNGRSKMVPTICIVFREETLVTIADDKGKIPGDIADSMRKLWQESTIPYGEIINRKKYCDSRMYVFTKSYERTCFYDFITNKKDDVNVFLKRRLGKAPYKIYTAHEGMSIVYETNDFTSLGIESKAAALGKEISDMAVAYVKEKYYETMEPLFYVRFCHPGMKDYNGYGLWLG